jgi:hypothetical protein
MMFREKYFWGVVLILMITGPAARCWVISEAAKVELSAFRDHSTLPVDRCRGFSEVVAQSHDEVE